MEGLFPPLAIAVCGAHLRGEPLHDQLCGAELLASTSTSQSYKLFALDSTRPALVKCNSGVGAKIEVEVYKLQDEASLGKLLISIPQPVRMHYMTYDVYWKTIFSTLTILQQTFKVLMVYYFLFYLY